MRVIAPVEQAASDINAAESKLLFFPPPARRRTPAVPTQRAYLRLQPIQWDVAAVWLIGTIASASLFGWFLHAVWNWVFS